jgi:hypothetical protein
MLGPSPVLEEVIITPLLDQHVDMEEEEEEGPGGTIKAPPPGLSDMPIPDPPDLLDAPSFLNVEKPRSTEGTPKADRASKEVTPTPERPIPSSSGLGFSPEPDLPSSPKKSPAGSRYGSIRTKSRPSTVRNKKASDADGYSASDEGAEHPTSRKTTLRPIHAHISTIFDLETADAQPPAKSTREVELEQRLAEMAARVKALEIKLKEASRPASPARSTSASSISERTRKDPGAVEYLLGRLGVVGLDDDGLPRRVGELPGYLFLVGVGVGAVMMRVLFRRAR